MPGKKGKKSAQKLRLGGRKIRLGDTKDFRGKWATRFLGCFMEKMKFQRGTLLIFIFLLWHSFT